MIKLCNSHLNANSPREGGWLRESVKFLDRTTESGATSLSPLIPFQVNLTGNMLVRITGSSILLGATVGSSTAHRLRTNRILESEAVGKAESVMRVPMSLYKPLSFAYQRGHGFTISVNQGLVELCLNIQHILCIYRYLTVNRRDVV